MSQTFYGYHKNNYELDTNLGKNKKDNLRYSNLEKATSVYKKRIPKLLESDIDRQISAFNIAGTVIAGIARSNIVVSYYGRKSDSKSIEVIYSNFTGTELMVDEFSAIFSNIWIANSNIILRCFGGNQFFP